MMIFVPQGTSPIDFINNPYVASETVKTLVGSFRLVLVAPLTAAIGMLLFGGGRLSYISVDEPGPVVPTARIRVETFLAVIVPGTAGPGS